MFMQEVLSLSTPRHILEWLNLIQNSKKPLLIEASRDHAKSFTLSCVLPIYRVQRVVDPAKAFRVALISYSEDQSKDNLQRIRMWIEGNDFLKWLKPNGGPQVWDARQLDLSNGCSIRAYGFNSSVRGQHPMLMVLDDVCKESGGMSLEEQVNIFTGSMVPALHRHGQMIITGNPVDAKDFLEWVEKNPAFDKHFYPVYNDRMEPLCPEWYSPADIEGKRRIIPTHKFAREYMLKRVSSADALFKEEWIKYYEPDEIKDLHLTKIMTIDPAISPVGDALGAVVTGSHGQKTYVLERMSFRGDFAEGIDELIEMMIRQQPDFVGVEKFAFQEMYRLWLEDAVRKRGLNFHVQELVADTRKKKAARILALQPKVRNGDLFFLEEHRPLIDQLLLFDPTAKHDENDEADALAWQVPLWEGNMPYEAPPPSTEAPEGSWQEAYEQIMKDRQSNFVEKLFDDMRYSA